MHDRRPVHRGGLIHHSDRGSQYVSIKYTERLAETGIEPSVGSVGDSYDNASGETINGLYKAELIHRRGPWRSFEAVEFATLEWVDWFNNRRLLEPIGNIPPAEAEQRYYATTLCWTTSPWPRNLNQSASGNHGAVQFLNWVAIVVGAVTASVALLILVLWFSVYQATEARIVKSLESHYELAIITVDERVDWKIGGDDWSAGGTVCFDIRVQPVGSEQVERRVAMVADGDDGGAFEFVREYPSMKQCRADFSRG